MMLWRKTDIMKTDMKEGLDGWSKNVGQVDEMIDTYHEDFKVELETSILIYLTIICYLSCWPFVTIF